MFASGSSRPSPAAIATEPVNAYATVKATPKCTAANEAVFSRSRRMGSSLPGGSARQDAEPDPLDSIVQFSFRDRWRLFNSPGAATLHGRPGSYSVHSLFTSTFTTSEANGFTVREIGVDRTSALLVRNVLAATIGPKTSSEEWTVVINVDFTAG